LKLTELSPAVVEAFSKDEIGVGHALLLARLQPAQQEEALNACFREEWMGADQKPKRILLPVRQLQVWIERNVLLILKDAPFDRENPQLVPAAGSCLPSCRLQCERAFSRGNERACLGRFLKADTFCVRRRGSTSRR
jgi:ParB family chromosome partitioning protein